MSGNIRGTHSVYALLFRIMTKGIKEKRALSVREKKNYTLYAQPEISLDK